MGNDEKRRKRATGKAADRRREPHDQRAAKPGVAGDSFTAAGVEAVVVDGLRSIGADPAKIYAVQATGRLVTRENYHLLTDAELGEWDDALARYRALHKDA